MTGPIIKDGLTKTQRYFLKHHNEIKERKKIRRQRPEVKAQEKNYAQSPKGRKLASLRVAKYLHSEKGIAYRKKWREENREHIRQLAKDYHHRPDIRIKERQRILLYKYGENAVKVLVRDNDTCRKCGGKEKIHIHHIDGDRLNNMLENLIVLCDSCHTSMHHYIPKNLKKIIFEEWLKNKDGEKTL